MHLDLYTDTAEAEDEAALRVDRGEDIHVHAIVHFAEHGSPSKAGKVHLTY